MIPLQITLHNFLSYIDPKPLDFSSFDLAVLLGENGAGKSSILEALTWAVWDKTRASSSDDLIHQGMKNMWVDFIFEHEGEIYRIFRRRDLKKQGISTLEFQIKVHQRQIGLGPKKNKKNLLDDGSWHSIAEGTLRATQEKIIDTLKLPYEIFTNTSYLRQGKADEFAIKTPSERKEILGEILGLEEWRKLEEKTKNKIKVISNEIEALNFQLEDLKNQISQKKNFEEVFETVKKEKEALQRNLEVLEKDFRKLDEQKRQKNLNEEKINNLRQRLEETIEEIKNFKRENKENNQEINSLSLIIKNKDVIVNKFQKLGESKNELEKVEKKQDTYLIFREKLILFDHKETDLKNKISQLRKISTCPTCLRLLKKEEAEGIIHSLENEYAKNYLPKRKEIEKALKNLGYVPQAHQKLKIAIQNLKDVEDQKRNLDIAEDSIKKLNKLNKKIEENLKVKLKLRHKIIAEGKSIKEKLAKLEKIVPVWQSLSEKIENQRQELLNLEGKFGALSQALKEIERQKEELKNKEKKLKEAEKETAVLHELVEAFGKKGIQAMIIEQAIPAIEENANEIVRQISDERMSLKFITQRAKKTAEELIETLDIKITDSQGERDYEMFSGGEAFRINFAVRVALSKFLASRSGIHLRFLAMDEGFGTLDAAGREDLIKTINSIRKEFAKIIIMTHIEELKDLFPTQIFISKNEKGSQIDVIG